ncbi:SdrD B-like domain-containing protein [Lentzea flaviverrucosa]|uniref:SdrD B-like domain-containing protein n=1 Tax=Lentzea flaviverrucosa TaxID=200379 RepID=UPI001160B13C|nr:SdrD B-like domain-containing protein [Lentzea flaviverrucosa]
MSDRSVSRAVLKIGVLATVTALAFSSTALAQPEPVSTPPASAETSAPPSSEPPPPPPPAQAPQPDSVAGVLYADKNGNGVQDPGEAVSGGFVSLLGNGDSDKRSARSDVDGKFVFRDLAPGTYAPTYTMDDGWVVHHVNAGGDLITIRANETTQVTARAERPYNEQLEVSATLDRESYRLPATAKITLNFHNIGNRKIHGIKPRCESRSRPEALGRGKGWDALLANGLTLDAGQKYTMTIDEEIPEAASLMGSVSLACAFAPNAGWNTDGPTISVQAQASGGAGAYTMVFGEDRNADARIEGDEAVEGLRVVLLDARNGAWVADATSGADGRIEFGGLPIGEYRAAVVGPWTFADSAQERVVITGKGGFGYRFLKSASPADLRVEIKLDKPRYESHETVHLELTITNTGGQTAERVWVEWVDGVSLPDEQWGEFSPYFSGGRIPAGESRTLRASGRISVITDGELAVVGAVAHLGMRDASGFRTTAGVVQTVGDLGGVVYTDENLNGRLDQGEVAADAEVWLSGGAPHTSKQLVTDAEGRFSAKGIPSGDYSISFRLAGGWIVHAEDQRSNVRIEPGEPLDLIVRAERPYTELFTATAELDKISYVLGETAKITIRFTSTAGREIRGIKAMCNFQGEVNHFGGNFDNPMPPGWGDLREGGPGVTLAAGGTKTIVVEEAVPAGAAIWQMAVLACSFGPNPVENSDVPSAFDWAAFQSGTGSLKGRLAHDRNNNHVVDPGETVTGARVLLMTDKEYGFQLAETVSDADGVMRFGELPPGEFWASVDGPWKFEGDEGRADIRGGELTERDFFVVPALHVTPPGGDQHAGGNTGGALAKTGASVLGLGALAVLLVVFGFGARVAGRRRTS